MRSRRSPALQLSRTAVEPRITADKPCIEIRDGRQTLFAWPDTVAILEHYAFEAAGLRGDTRGSDLR